MIITRQSPAFPYHGLLWRTVYLRRSAGGGARSDQSKPCSRPCLCCKEMCRLMEPVYAWDATDIFIYLSVQGNIEINQACRPVHDEMVNVRVGIPKIPGKKPLIGLPSIKNAGRLKASASILLESKWFRGFAGDYMASSRQQKGRVFATRPVIFPFRLYQQTPFFRMMFPRIAVSPVATMA